MYPSIQVSKYAYVKDRGNAKKQKDFWKEYWKRKRSSGKGKVKKKDSPANLSHAPHVSKACLWLKWLKTAAFCF